MSEQLGRWAGEFGNSYVDRNRYDWTRRIADYKQILPDGIRTALEVGSNIGNNLKALTEIGIPAIGVEVNKKAAGEAAQNGYITVLGEASNLPFPDNSFDLVFTCGVLMHIKDHERAMSEIWRVTRKYALAIEYMGDDGVIPYHGFDDMLWKRPSYIYPGEEIGYGQLGQEFDRCFYQLFKKA